MSNDPESNNSSGFKSNNSELNSNNYLQLAITESLKGPAIRKLPEYKPEDYLQFDVRGDGNCFYRSLYNATKYHPIPGTFERLARCIGIPADVNETTFIQLVRQKLALGINNKLMENLAKSAGDKGFTIYHKIRQAAAMAIRGSPFLWTAFLNDASREIQIELLQRPAKDEPLTQAQLIESAKQFNTMQPGEFKKRLANIVRRDKVYASEIDIALLLHMLANCGENSVHVSMLSPNDTVAPADIKEGLPHILIRRLGEHYNYYVKGSVLNANAAKLQAARQGQKVGDEIEEVYPADRTAIRERIEREQAERRARLLKQNAEKAAAKAKAEAEAAAKAKAAEAAKAKAAAAKAKAAAAKAKAAAAKAANPKKTTVKVPVIPIKKAKVSTRKQQKKSPSSSNSNTNSSSVGSIPNVGTRKSKNNASSGTRKKVPVNSNENQFIKALEEARAAKAAVRASAKPVAKPVISSESNNANTNSNSQKSSALQMQQELYNQLAKKK